MMNKLTITIIRIEQALQTVCPGEDVCMHYWDETSEETLEHGLPPILTDEKVKFGNLIKAPNFQNKAPQSRPLGRAN